MPLSPQQPFGRRGRIENAAVFSNRAQAAIDLTPNVSPDIVAAVMGGSSRGQAAAPPSSANVGRVAWSFRAAVLAGLIVALFDAAARATHLMSFGADTAIDHIPLASLGLNQISLGQAGAPLAVLVAAAGLWSGARASALALFVVHTILGRLGRTSRVAYSLGGAAACLAYAMIAALLWDSTSPAALFMDTLSGFGAGFFYRLFASTERN